MAEKGQASYLKSSWRNYYVLFNYTFIYIYLSVEEEILRKRKLFYSSTSLSSDTEPELLYQPDTEKMLS